MITIAGLATVTATFNVSLSVPDAPTIGTAVAGNGQAMLTFTPPAFNGGSSITSYTATCNPNTFTGSSTFSPVSVPNLVNGTLYTCSVRAINSVGPSIASATVTVTPSLAAPPALVNVFSRKSHSGMLYDVNIQTGIAIAGLVSVEPRAIGNGHTIYFRFSNTITNPGNVVVVDGNSVSVPVTSTASGNDVIVTIPSLADNKRITISLSNAAGPSGTAATQSVSMGFLVGDFNSNRAVNASDISAVKAQTPFPVSQANFKFDVNTSGGITSTDVSSVKARAGLVLP